MGKIKRLNEELVSKIAAGEIVNNPANVVKELLENAIDAKATSITIDLENAGKKRIELIDDGIGMDREDLELCTERHTTSKISSESDLFNIRSLGFRGEALASISSVSEFTVISRTKDSINGYKLEGSIVLPTASNVGTRVIVKNLFYNTPARKKYLKSDQTELRYITEIVTRYALIYFNITFKYMNNGRILLNVSKTDDMIKRARAIYGNDIHIIELNDDNIYGFIGKPYYTRSDRNYQTLFINNRLVKNPILAKAVEEAYSSLLFHGQHPIFALSIDIPPNKVDVNVHPAKTTVKISEESLLYRKLFSAVRKTLEKSDLKPRAEKLPSTTLATKRPSLKKYDVPKDKQMIFETRTTYGDNIRHNDEDMNNEDMHVDDNDDVRIIGQFNLTYILVETKEGLAIIDQHAAHERILYERFYEQYENIEKQRLLSPVIVELSPAEYDIFTSNLDYMKELGFTIEEFGDNSYVIRDIPKVFSLSANDIIDIMKTDVAKEKIEDKIRLIVATMACRAAIKAGDELTMPQMKELLKAMEEPKFPYSCPHGRPTMITLTEYDLEKLFKRKG